MAQTLDRTMEIDMEIDQESEELDLEREFAPTAHPPVALPGDGQNSLRLGFAPAPTVYDTPIVHETPTVPLNEAVIETADRPAPLVRPIRTRRSRRVDWYEIAVIGLILACGALCVYRLAWAIQP